MSGAVTKSAHDFDPLDEALRPPINETEEDRVIRQAQEAEARRVSQAIDDSIRAEKQAQKKKGIVRLLLLGQSESGKSTTLRHFQKLYTPTAFHEERILWRSVIQLNIVRSVRTILDALSDIRLPTLDSGGEDSDDSGTNLPQELEMLQMRLTPLRHIEALLIAKLIPPSEDEVASVIGSSAISAYHSHRSRSSERSWRAQEVFVRPGATWKGALAKSTRTRPVSLGNTGMQTRDEAQEVIHSCSYDIMALWNDRLVREVLRRRKIRLEESSGFFLNDLDRVTALNYTPNDDDVLRARLKTVGVSEYRCEMEAVAGRESGTEWRIVDVGGSRSQRATWVPFFDDVDAIIFLAPISSFDQVLAEDRSVNRLEDSVLLWKAVCSNKLLANVDLVLFLNKCDILDAKLTSGIRLSKYVRSYGDRPNDMETASKYFRSKFSAIHREYSPLPRKFYGFCTTVTDTTTTAGILASVRDMVVRRHLKQSRLL
ncbi:guanine nucleotide binding protein, alpha subunit [Suillus discolor]|uniref:Guanine nucleotide binding protein, alpha subunit n=1 Tax=Suillus discolor TaxID=1912936 RepID=A0A9P7F4N2_9AGAM|nr:guanine nucleotide binding protein, alpha subunit [Suillus discolor]KAG1826368.1 guanine nucleotide binding protein, alpha subunit [Suillus variegatus]KAG2104414.1 guanine nucleotide binding protein, alpha subunit [Suillus discolor]